MKYRVFICMVALFFCSASVYSQGIEGNAAQENLDKIGSIDYDIGVVRKFDHRYEGTKGSPFYLDNWTDGFAEFESGRTAENVKLKYNMFEDELLILDPKSGAIYVDKNNVKSFALHSVKKEKTDAFIKLPDPKKDDSFQYYRILFAGKMYLFEYTKVVYEKANFQGGYSNEKTYDEFKKYPGYYIMDPKQSRPSKLKSSAGAVSKAFPNHQNEIKKFISKNLLDCRKEEDLLKVFRHYDDLP